MKFTDLIAFMRFVDIINRHNCIYNILLIYHMNHDIQAFSGTCSQIELLYIFVMFCFRSDTKSDLHTVHKGHERASFFVTDGSEDCIYFLNCPAFITVTSKHKNPIYALSHDISGLTDCGMSGKSHTQLYLQEKYGHNSAIGCVHVLKSDDVIILVRGQLFIQLWERFEWFLL